jgi:hypothetical protein
MVRASLGMWPDQPDLDNSYQPNEKWPKINTMMRFVFGLSHADSHLGQIKEIVRQAKTTVSE